MKEEKAQEAKEDKDKAKDNKAEKEEGKKGKLPLKFAGIKRKSVDIRRSLEVPSSPVPRKSSEVLPKGDREAKEKVDREAADAKDADKGKVVEGAVEDADDLRALVVHDLARLRVPQHGHREPARVSCVMARGGGR